MTLNQLIIWAAILGLALVVAWRLKPTITWPIWRNSEESEQNGRNLFKLRESAEAGFVIPGLLAIVTVMGALLCSGCTILSAAGITPQSAPMILAVAAETKAGVNVIRASATGDVVKVRLACFVIRQARTAVNGTVRLQMSEDVRNALDESRRLTEGVCLEAGVPLPIPGN